MDNVGSDRLQGGPAAPNRPRAILTRRERLERWATLLERCAPDERLSPIDIAYSDRVLRAQGYASPGLSDASAFFGLDHVVINSLAQPVAGAEAKLVARRLRRFAARNDRTMLAAGLAAASVVSVPFLAYIFA
ncbi:MAG: hypothetical protein MEP57_08915 [Microvirga sp.]|nr:hypothetical protein [Microvirga sp.]